MLNRIKSIFAALDSAPDSDEVKAVAGQGFGKRELAACALMVEAAAQDGTIDAKEEAVIRSIAERSFGLKAEEVDLLMAEAAKAQDKANHLIRFTRAIKDEFDEDERIELIEMLWEVAYADGILHDYEANLLRRVGGLIYVSDRARGEARKRVLARLGIAP
ncbi:MAG: TerB family tellurite resistance protein [Proteobacteria bacterium]|nr:TerB family tellurite resistance protein [Pseudomonadota bacterium]